MTTILKADQKGKGNISQIRCSLCGFSFILDNCNSTCQSCPISLNCSINRCPNCGYTFPPLETNLQKILKWLSHKIKSYKGEKNE